VVANVAADVELLHLAVPEHQNTVSQRLARCAAQATTALFDVFVDVDVEVVEILLQFLFVLAEATQVIHLRERERVHVRLNGHSA
jgi:hypothetical protein